MALHSRWQENTRAGIFMNELAKAIAQDISKWLKSEQQHLTNEELMSYNLSKSAAKYKISFKGICEFNPDRNKPDKDLNEEIC